MARRHYDLPSLTTLAAFEAAARLASFKESARELNVTPGAVSHQIKSLEQELAVKLFLRGHRSVELTAEGQILYEAMSQGFAAMSQGVRALRHKTKPDTVTIGATTSVSSLWLTPRLGGFWREHSAIAVSQLVEDQKFLRPFKPDLIIEYATEPPKDRSDLLFADILVPLCAPGYPRSEAPGPHRVAQERLIHLDAPARNWTTWSSWFDALGYSGPVRTAQTVNNYSIALQLAQEGNGVVLGWQRLVAPLIDRGLLEPYCELSSPAPGAFYLVQGAGETSEPVRLFRDWLLNSIGLDE